MIFNSSVFFILFLAGTVFDFVLNQFLEASDFFFRKKHGKQIPERLKDFLNAQELEKTCAYEDAKYFVWIPSNILNFILKLALVLSGFYVFLYENFYNFTENVFATVILFSIVSGIPSFIVNLPFSLYREFRIEKKFGFSNMNLKMWILDFAKSTVLSAVIAIPILCAATALIVCFNKIWWLLFAIVYLAFSLGISYIYPVLIAPIFNKFSPLEEGEIKERIEKLFAKTGFKTSGIFTMDASRRSNHSNAYFTGFGKNKRIVLYDTLIKQLEPSEIEAVLGHELGHCKKHHIAKRMIVMIPLVFVSLLAASLIAKLPPLYSAFGYEPLETIAPYIQPLGLLFIGLVFEGYGNIVSLVSNFFSRKDEFQADAYSKEMCGTFQALISALIKLNKENLSELEPPKIYSMFNYSHPPLMERIKALES